jgi:hypothetical protein
MCAFGPSLPVKVGSKWQPLASRNLLPTGATPIKNTDVGQNCSSGYLDFANNISIVGTPVIDVAAGTMYLVARYKLSGSFYQRLHALDVTNLAERANSPVTITASVAGTGEGSVGGTITFNPQTQAQRAGLVLTGGRVYVTWASHCDTSPYHGWVIGYNPTSLAREFVWNSSKNGGLVGIWQAGQAPAANSSGHLFVMTGNGTSDARTGGSSYGNSFVRLNPSLSNPVVTWFTPYNVDNLNQYDTDLGASGPLLMPDVTNRIIGIGKEGKFYVLNSDSMGGFNSGSDSQIVQSFVATAGHVHGSPAYYASPTAGKLVYVWAEYDYLKAFSWNGSTLATTPQKTSTMKAPDGMPGAALSISANGSVNGTGIVWASMPYVGDANHALQPGILRALDANDVSKELWNSRMNNVRDEYGLLSKYNPPTVANGKVYMATASKKLVVYGLLSQGLRGEYFDNKDLTGTKVTRIDQTVNNDWGSGSPDPGIATDSYSVRWTGQVQPQYSETYTFYTQSDDGVRLWVNDVLLVDNWTDHSSVENSGTIALTANTKYSIRMEYYENTGSAVAKLSWSSPSRTKQIIPKERLFPKQVEWHFSEDNESWSVIQGVSQTVSGGKLIMTITGSDPQIQGPDGLHADALFFKMVRVRLKNATSDTTAQLYWNTHTNGTFDEAKHVDFAIDPNDTKMREYRIDLSGNANWTGKIRRLRLHPVKTATSGTVELDSLRMSPYTGFADGIKYKLKNRNSGKVADVSGASTSDGANIQQWNDNESNNQLWEFVDFELGGYYYIVPKHSQKCMEVAGNSTAAGANIQQRKCEYKFGQHFKWIWVTGSYYRIENRNSANPTLTGRDGPKAHISL